MAQEFATGGSLEGFTEPRPFTVDGLAGVPQTPGVHVVWDPEGKPLYVGMSGRTRERLRMHQTGDREASVLHKDVGELLDAALGREASRDEIADWLSRCTFSWKETEERQRVKASLMDAIGPRFNKVRPAVGGEVPEVSPWDEFCRWVDVFYSDSAFDSGERDYKLVLGRTLQQLRDDDLSADDLGERVVAALRSREHNLLRWNLVDAVEEWESNDIDGFSGALRSLWNSESDLDARLRMFFERFPTDGISGAGSRANVGSLLLLADDPTAYPPFQPTLIDDGFRLVGYPPGDERGDPRARYLHALSFFDRIVTECRDRGIELRDRLDAQSILWSVLKNPLPEGSPEADVEALNLYRQTNATTWWVNQGATYKEESDGKFIWAPQKTKAGHGVKHHTDVGRVKRGDVIVHYANGAIRALGHATRAGRPGDRPESLTGEAWQQEGFTATVRYYVLDQPIELNEIPIDEREADATAFNVNGGVNQGYLYGLSEGFAGGLRERFADRWPSGSPWFSEEPPQVHDPAGDPLILCVATAMSAVPEVEGVWSWAQWHSEYNKVKKGDVLIFGERSGRDGVFSMARVVGPGIVETVDLEEPYELEFGGVESVDSIGGIGGFNESRIRRALQRSAREGGRGVIVSEIDSWGEQPGLSGAVSEFSDALDDVGLQFDPEFVGAFVVSLATKGFVLLTGLSGSGKTKIAQSFGQWLGEGRSLVVPVRPDWTGPEALLGYEDGLSATGAWRVPRSLEFMLRAARDPGHPYLLLLDEMNLAHVERYFADVLSGIESGEGVVPNLTKVAVSGHSEWRLDASRQSLEWPANLLVVGTVNIDETTYMFSPKVLDRANTLEFRVPTNSLVGSAKPIAPVAPGSSGAITAFHDSLTDTADLSGWDGAEVFADRLRELHVLLSRFDREFGHRVFAEALRFGALHAQLGETSTSEALDLQVLQKVLPRFHGSIRQIARPLAAVGSWAFSGTADDDFDPRAPQEDSEPWLPLSFDKVRRMTERLHENHFVSFAE